VDGALAADQELKMTFTPNIPQSGQTLGNSQSQVLNNFTNYFNTMSVNHVAPNNSGAGKHNLAELVVQAQSPATAAAEVAIYSRSPSGTADLYLQAQSQLANATDIQMSRLDEGIKTGSAGWTFLPGGMIMQWGSCVLAAAGQLAVVYTTQGGVAFKSATYQVFLTVNDPGSPITPIPSFVVNGALTAKTGFTVSTNRGLTLDYLAIGM
jgi:hypothetical protein